MYSRNYYSDRQDRLNLPDNYDGTTFMERSGDESADQTLPASYIDEASTLKSNVEADSDRSKFKPTILTSLFSSDGLLGNLGLSMPNLGAEEILIIATAAFLFFSKNGDKECALILLLLLFIN